MRSRYLKFLAKLLMRINTNWVSIKPKKSDNKIHQHNELLQNQAKQARKRFVQYQKSY